MTQRFLHLRLTLEEYNPELFYTRNSKNIAINALIGLDIDTSNPVWNSIYASSEQYGPENECISH